jgi:hypothetical protein
MPATPISELDAGRRNWDSRRIFEEILRKDLDAMQAGEVPDAHPPAWGAHLEPETSGVQNCGATLR